ncbi:MAG: hypothetical protein NXH82_07975 [Rhodobacteraceae bacterium]|nr:hypothetical protein [Paracoccaceae bacterium]
MTSRNGFESFYYTHVATGEGCGCAERVIDVHEFNRLAGRTPRTWRPLLRLPAPGAWRRFLNAAGLTRRPARPPET